MSETVAVLIASTEKNKVFLKQLILSLWQQSIVPEQVTIIYGGNSLAEKQTFDSSPVSMRWISNQEDVSLTELMNRAVFLMRQKHVLLLNDDITLDGDFIKTLLKIIETDKSLGIVTGKILRIDRETIDSAGQFLAKNRKPQDRGYGHKDHGQYNIPEFVFGACGAAVMYRRKMLEDIQIAPGEYFDNDYHMFYEDLDIAWRAQNAGWKAYYNPKAVAYHVRGASARGKKPPLKIFRCFYFPWLDTELKSHFIKNRWMTIIKNDTLRDFLLNLPHILGYDIKIFLYCLFFDPMVLIKGFKNLPFITKAFKKRKLIKKNK